MASPKSTEGRNRPVGRTVQIAARTTSLEHDSTRKPEFAGRQSFAVEVRQSADAAIVQPTGELDLATVETLRDKLDALEGARRVVLDLRNLSFIDSTGLQLLVALDQRARRDGFQLELVAPLAPADRAIHVSGLDRALPFVSAVDALDTAGVRGATCDRAADRGQ